MASSDNSDMDHSYIAEAEEQVNKLYHFRDHYFELHPIEKAAEKNVDIGNELDKTIKKLSELKVHCENENRAKYNLLHGKALNIKPQYDEHAEEFLAKAVKLDPKLIEAWNELGKCYWKKGCIDEAKDCFQGALNHKKNKISLRQLSMVLRQFKEDGKERLKNIEESVVKAREAVELDVSDGTSWCILGNAYLNLFFASDQNPKLMKLALKAYSQAGKDPVAENNPDLHHNRATVYKYEEEYKLALEDFAQAQAVDPSWSSPREKGIELLNYLNQVQNLIEKKGCVKAKRLQQFVKSLTEQTHLGPYGGGSYTSPSGTSIKLELALLADLKVGINLNKVILGKVVCNITSGDPVPFTFCIIDKDETCWSVTVYNLVQGSGVIIGDSVAIPEPFVQQVDFTHKDQKFHFFNIRVDTPLVLVVNGKKLGADKQAKTEINVSVLAS